jgi:hypothetical protein
MVDATVNTRMEDSLIYSLDTATVGGNSTIGASGGKLGFFQNNLQAMIQSAERNGRLKDLSFSATPILNKDINMTAEVDDTILNNLDLTATHNNTAFDFNLTQVEKGETLQQHL